MQKADFQPGGDLPPEPAGRKLVCVFEVSGAGGDWLLSKKERQLSQVGARKWDRNGSREEQRDKERRDPKKEHSKKHGTD